MVSTDCAESLNNIFEIGGNYGTPINWGTFYKIKGGPSRDPPLHKIFYPIFFKRVPLKGYPFMCYILTNIFCKGIPLMEYPLFLIFQPIFFFFYNIKKQFIKIVWCLGVSPFQKGAFGG